MLKLHIFPQIILVTVPIALKRYYDQDNLYKNIFNWALAYNLQRVSPLSLCQRAWDWWAGMVLNKWLRSTS